jgi:hypothetical protein
VFVTHAHFETEYSAMKEVSQRLAEVKIAVLTLHPADAREKMSPTERTQRIAELKDASETYRAKLQERAVFIEPHLYDKFEHCYIGAHVELKRLQASTSWPENQLNVEYFWRSYGEACQAVRDRIQSLAVLPRT